MTGLKYLTGRHFHDVDDTVQYSYFVFVPLCWPPLFAGTYRRGRVDVFSLFDGLSPFYFLFIKFFVAFPFLIKYYRMFIVIVFKLGSVSSAAVYSTVFSKRRVSERL